MVLGKLPVPGRPTSLENSRARAYCACSWCGWVWFGYFFSHLSFLSSFSLSLVGVLLVWKIVGQGPTVLAVGAGGGGLDIFSLIYHFSLLSPFLWETARYRLKYCLKGPLSLKQPTNQHFLKI